MGDECRTMRYWTVYSPLSGLTHVRTDDGRTIYPSEDNPEYQKYLAWVAEGNEAEPWEPEQ